MEKIIAFSQSCLEYGFKSFLGSQEEAVWLIPLLQYLLKKGVKM